MVKWSMTMYVDKNKNCLFIYIHMKNYISTHPFVVKCLSKLKADFIFPSNYCHLWYTCDIPNAQKPHQIWMTACEEAG